MHSRQSAFTLMELLVVIAIIGILSSVVLANLNGSRAKARDTKRIADIKSLQLSLELYFDANVSYPANTAGLVPVFISALPKDPSTNADYAYANGGNTYSLSALLEGPAGGIPAGQYTVHPQ